jgi:pyruvate,water dikinase
MMHLKNQLPAARYGGFDQLYGSTRNSSIRLKNADEIQRRLEADEAGHAVAIEHLHDHAITMWRERTSGSVKDVDVLRANAYAGNAMFVSAMVRHIKSRIFLQEALAVVRSVVKEDELWQRLTAGVGVEEVNLAGDLWSVAKGKLSRDDFIARRGYYGSSEGDVRAPSWREAPYLLDPVVDKLSQADSKTEPVRRLADTRAERAKALDQARVALTQSEAQLLESALGRADVTLRCLELGKAAYLMSIDVVRYAARGLGSIYRDNAILDERDDVFHLTIDELMAELPADVKQLVAIRRAAWQSHQGVTLPTAWIGNPEPIEAISDTAQNSGELRGLPASSGVVSARVRLVTNPSEIESFEPGEIVVAPITNPSWTPLLMLCGGLVVDIGNAFSHAAIIARELQVPCVMNTQRAMTSLRDGCLVRIDGEAGTVVTLEQSNA